MLMPRNRFGAPCVGSLLDAAVLEPRRPWLWLSQRPRPFPVAPPHDASHLALFAGPTWEQAPAGQAGKDSGLCRLFALCFSGKKGDGSGEGADQG